MSLESRLTKLERRIPAGNKQPLFVFYSIFEPNPEGKPSPGRSYPGPARIIGSGLGLIQPHEGESEAAFRLRVYAIKAGGKMVEDMTEEERVAAYAEAEIARAKYEESRI